MAKTHYGYKDGQFKQGKCEVTTGTCPYGNHSEDPNKINDLREYVAKTLNENPNYQVAYEMVARMHGEKNVTAAALVKQGIPAKLAKAWANEPVSAEYERDYVEGSVEESSEADGASVESPVESLEAQENAVSGLDDVPTFSTVAPGEGRSVYEQPATVRGYDGWKHWLNGSNRIARFQRAAEKLAHPEQYGELTSDDKKTLEEPYKELDYIQQQAMADFAVNNIKEPLPVHLRVDTFDEMKNFGEPGNEINDKIIAGVIRDELDGITAEDREFARGEIDSIALLSNEHPRLSTEAFYDVPLQNTLDAGKDPNTEQKKLNLATHISYIAGLRADALKAKAIRFTDDEDATVADIAERAKKFKEKRKILSMFSAPEVGEGSRNVSAELYDNKVAAHWKRNMRPGAYIMLGNMDTEVYTLQEDGGIVSSDGKLVGYANYETGELHGRGGEPIHATSGMPRLFKNDEQLLKHAVADGEHKERTVANNSADPGFYSRHELSKSPRVQSKLADIRNFFEEKDEDYEDVARRKESISNALANEKPAKIYEALRSKGLEKIDALEPGSKATSEEKNQAEHRVRDFVRKSITDGDLEYTGNGSFISGSGLSISDLENVRTLDYDQIFDENDSVATRASMVAAVRRNRNFKSSFTTAIADSSKRPGRYSPVAHRRRHWNPAESPAPATQARTGELVINPKPWYNEAHETYVVVDADQGLMAPVDQKYISGWQTGTDPIDSPVSEETVQALIDRYNAGERRLAVPIRDTNDEGEPLQVW